MLEETFDEDTPEFSVKNVDDTDLLFEILEGDWTGLQFRMSSVYDSDGSVRAAKCLIEKTPGDVDINESTFGVVAQSIINEVIKDKPDRLH